MTKTEFSDRIDSFFVNHDGKKYGFPNDKSYYGECLSIVKIYMQEVLGLANPPSSGANAAYGYWTNFPAPLGDYFEKIPNSSTAVPERGDVIVWGTGIGTYGHIAISVGVGDTNTFDSFDQNWPSKSVCHYQHHDYRGVLGWLRPKNINDAEVVQIDPKDQRITDLENDLAIARRDLDNWKNSYNTDTSSLKAQIEVLKNKPAQIKTVTVEKIVPQIVEKDILTEEEKTAFIKEYERTHPPVIKTEYVTKEITVGDALSVLWNTIKNIKIK